MIKKLLSVAFVATTFISQGQFSYTEPPTNGKNSEYKFTKVSHLDATPVQSQGYTGTCWSFSAL